MKGKLMPFFTKCKVYELALSELVDEDCVGGTVIKWSQYNDDDVFNYNDNIPVSENTGMVGHGSSGLWSFKDWSNCESSDWR